MKNRNKIGIVAKVGLFAIVCLSPIAAKAAKKEIQIANPEQVNECKKIGVYRGKADHPLFKRNTLEQLETEAMDELVAEAKRADATHLVKGFTYRISSGIGSIDMVFQFGVAYECPVKIEN
jgi:hypothetical protein